MARTTAKTAKKERQGFQPGKSGNPKGRPHGSRNKATLAVEALLDGQAEALTQVAIQSALEGDLLALRLCLQNLPASQVPPHPGQAAKDRDGGKHRCGADGGYCCHGSGRHNARRSRDRRGCSGGEAADV